jgi:SOS-response transcriptional repressor LexA
MEKHMAKAPVDGLADRLRIARTRMQPEVLQKEAGKQVGRTAPCIGQWESGKSEPSFSDLLTLARFYGVSTDWLLGQDTKNAQATESLLMSRDRSTNSVPVLASQSLMQDGELTGGAYMTTGRAYPQGSAFAWIAETDAVNRCATGDIVIVERATNDLHAGLYMIVAADSKAPTLRRCRLDEGQKFFAPDSNGYPTYNASEVRVIGRVREIIKHVLID